MRGIMQTCAVCVSRPGRQICSGVQQPLHYGDAASLCRAVQQLPTMLVLKVQLTVSSLPTHASSLDTALQ